MSFFDGLFGIPFGCNGLFGDFFDFDGDGFTSLDEELLGLAILEDIDNSENDEYDDDDEYENDL